MDGDLIIVGAPLDNTLGSQTGECFVFDLGSATPTVPVLVLPNPEPGSSDRFGSAVAISGNRVAVGVSLDDHFLGELRVSSDTSHDALAGFRDTGTATVARSPRSNAAS